MRENDLVADSLGKNLVTQRISVLVIGGALAGLSGGILVGYINTWAPGRGATPKRSCCSRP